jgi:hypothetical protein
MDRKNSEIIAFVDETLLFVLFLSIHIIHSLAHFHFSSFNYFHFIDRLLLFELAGFYLWGKQAVCLRRGDKIISLIAEETMHKAKLKESYLCSYFLADS